MDEKDKQILKEIKGNARMSYFMWMFHVGIPCAHNNALIKQ